ncbi:MAG TPA: aminotransferase class IV, partial [Gammaproteobacteria bacterium]|nr:aminotransferase class IV [Gammaproteobacteria bacterium]
LWGITRDFVLSLARKHHIDFEERALCEDELYDADEIWITSSGREVVPITRLNDHIVGDGEVGPIWKKISASYESARNACSG